MTSNCAGSWMASKHSASTYMCCASTSGCAGVLSAIVRRVFLYRSHSSWACRIAFDLRPRIFECCADDSFDTLAGVQVFIAGDFVRGSAPELSAHSDIDTLGVLAEHHEIDVLRAA